jgi:hypothetical protein
VRELTLSTFITFQHTATNDAPFRLTDDDIPFFEANFYVETQDCLYGTAVSQDAPKSAGNSFWFDRGNLRDIWFKNAAVGVNTKIVVVATVPVKETLEKLGLIG